MPERDWLYPSIVLTIVAAATALAFIPHFSGLLPALFILPAWMAAAALIGSFYGLAWMIIHKIDQPVAQVRQFMAQNLKKLLFLAFFALVAGFNMIVFMWTKPLLNYLIPFRADPWLANAGRAIFLGHDPWRVLRVFNFPGAGLVYHPIWFIVMILALLIAVLAPTSPRKSAALLSYFTLWSVVAPCIHILIPAAGPIFYERLGFGQRFHDLDGGAETTAVGNYLWEIYASKSFGAGSGISAMPSMHVAISAWAVIVFCVFAPRLAGAAVAAWLLIFALSISLGWHYVLDGVVGSLASVGCYFFLLQLFIVKNKLGSMKPTHVLVWDDRQFG